MNEDTLAERYERTMSRIFKYTHNSNECYASKGISGYYGFSIDIRGLLEKYLTFGRKKETGLPGELDT